MVLEQAFRANWLERRPMYAFFLGLLYTIIAIVSARLIFPQSSSIMSVAFTALLLVPSLNKLLGDEENVEIREKKVSLPLLFKDHKDIFEVYFFLFLGIFSMFSIIGIMMPEDYLLHAFSNQLRVAGLTGSATLLGPDVMSIFMNNLLVLLVCFLLSLAYGAGAVLFLVWNASVWGIVFGFALKTPAYFAVKIVPVLPHMFGETAAYCCAAIVGGVVSKAVLREKLFSDTFDHIVTDAGILMGLSAVIIFIAAIVEVKLYPYLNYHSQILFTMTVGAVVLLGLYWIVRKERQNIKRIFKRS